MSCNCSHTIESHAPETTHGVSRRSLVASTGLGVAVLGLSACGSDNAGELTDDKGPSEPTDMIAASEVPVGGVIKATSGKLSVMVAQPEEGTFKAYSSVCTHQGCQLNVQGKIMACPCHASQFDIKDGSVIGGPAPDPLPEYKAEVKDGRVIVSQNA